MTDITNNIANGNDVVMVNEQISNSLKLKRQTWNLCVLNIKRYLFTRYMQVLLMLGALPLAIAILAVANMKFQNRTVMQISEMNKILQLMFRIFYIHFVIFFVANIFGFSLLRKEIDDKTLHYLLLQPVSKTAIILSKFASFIIIAWLYLSVMLILTNIVLLTPYGIENLTKQLFVRGEVFSLIQKTAVILLALIAYGSISMVMGSLLKSGTWGVLFYLWESGLPYLPSTVKYFTVSHYLQALTPGRSLIPPKMFELYGTLPSAFQSILTLMIVSSIFCGIAIFIIRHYECRYN